jgi:hypothetical protein
VVVLNLRCGASVRKWQILLQKSFVSLPGLRFNEHLDEEDGPLVFAHAGRSPHWIKSKNPTAPAVKREAEEDWGR